MAEVVLLAFARAYTSTLKAVGDVFPISLALMDVGSDDVALTAFQPVTLVKLLAASESVETKD